MSHDEYIRKRDEIELGHSNWVDSQHIRSNNGSFRLSPDETKQAIDELVLAVIGERPNSVCMDCTEVDKLYYNQRSTVKGAE